MCGVRIGRRYWRLGLAAILQAWESCTYSLCLFLLLSFQCEQHYCDAVSDSSCIQSAGDTSSVPAAGLSSSCQPLSSPTPLTHQQKFESTLSVSLMPLMSWFGPMNLSKILLTIALSISKPTWRKTSLDSDYILLHGNCSFSPQTWMTSVSTINLSHLHWISDSLCSLPLPSIWAADCGIHQCQK